MKVIRAVALSADSNDYIADVEWVGFEKLDMPWEIVLHINADALHCLTNQLRKTSLAKDIRKALTTKNDVKR